MTDRGELHHRLQRRIAELARDDPAILVDTEALWLVVAHDAEARSLSIAIAELDRNGSRHRDVFH